MARKPVAGIAAACVIALYLFIWARSGARNPAYQDTRAMANGLYALGSMVLLVGALMSVGGHRWGNRVVRVTSWVMLPLVVLLLFVIHDRLREVYERSPATPPG